MKKTFIIFGLCLLMLGGGVYLWPSISRIWEKDVLYIAAVGPMTGVDAEQWRDMLDGINLYLNEANREGVIKGKLIRLMTFDDQNQARFAAKIASDVASDNDVLLVLGNYSDNAAMAAGDIYQGNGIPAITASAKSDEITRDNDWYFRITPNSSFEMRFLASYIKHVLQQDSVSIIYDNDQYGRSLMSHFEVAAQEPSVNIKIDDAHIWKFDRTPENIDENLQAESLERQLQKIVAELRTVEDPGVIFLATHEIEGAKIIRSINNPEMNYTIVGSSPFATPTFRHEFQQYLQEQVQPGYYSDGIYAVTPFLIDVAPDAAQHFRRDFENMYRRSPSWVAAAYYDAARVAVESIKLAEVDTKDPPFKKRQKIRDALANISEPEVAVQGVTGDIYFNKDGDVFQSLPVGRYQQQNLLPAYAQYQLFRDVEDEENMIKILSQHAAFQGHILSLGDHNLVKEIQIVNTGIDINEISRIDMRHAKYTLDFYLWFRFQKDFDDTYITFPNAVNIPSLGIPILEQTTGQYTVRAYHVTGEFTSESDLHAYPFEQPILGIALFHNNKLTTSLRYVPDVVGMPTSLLRIENGEDIIDPQTGWKVRDVSSYQSIRPYADSLNPPSLPTVSQLFTRSQFNTDIRIARVGIGFVAKNFFPLFILFLILYNIYAIPVERLKSRLLICVMILVGTTLYHYHGRQRFEFSFLYVSVFEKAIFAMYLFLLLATAISVFSHYKHTRIKTVQVLEFAGRFIHVAGGLGVILLVLYVVYQQNNYTYEPIWSWFTNVIL